MTRTPDMLAIMRERGVYEPEEFDAWLRERGWAWQALERGEYELDLTEALLLFTFEDPVRFAETYYVEPDTGAPYRFFDYQRESMRAWRQDCVHEDGAEVGKTREIVALLGWAHCTAMGGTLARPTSLVAAPQQTHLDEIILAIEEQFGAGDDGAMGRGFLSQFWLKPKRTPHTMHRFRCPNPLNPERFGTALVYYRPAGVDGEAFRGLHVNAFGLYDEAAKAKRKVHMSEFVRALKPGCRQRLYSVPDGDRATEFYRLCQQAVIGLPEGQPGMRKFHWPKTIMPPPFWTPEREQEFIKRYGGRDTPGYQRNVLGMWGDAENPVFRWEDLLPNIAELPDFRVIELLWDAASGSMAVTVKRIRLAIGDRGAKSAQEDWLSDIAIDLAPFKGGDDERRAAFRDLVRAHVVVPRHLGVLWAGADLGERADPTEIIVSEEVGPLLRDVLRVKAKGFPYHAQCELIHALHTLFGCKPFWGADLGNAGTAVVKTMQSEDKFRDGDYDVHLSGFHFQNTVECRDENGLVLEEETGDGPVPIKAPAKHWATQMIVSRLQAGGFAIAFDTAVLDSMTSHTARAGTKWPIYAKVNDHAIDARRQQMLRKLFNEDLSVPDVFSSGAIARRVA